MKVAYLKEQDESVIFTGTYMECYLPMYYFDKGVASLNGDIVETFGIFNFRIISNANQKIAETKLHTFKAATFVNMKPSEIGKAEMELIKGAGTEQYMILKFYNGDKVLTSTNVVANVNNTELFLMKLLCEGKLPQTIGYEDVFKLLLQNLELNKMNLGVSGMLYGSIVSEIYRSKSDLSLPFRRIIGKDNKVSQTDYKAVNMRTICSLSSTFAATTFEDIDAMLISSINRKRYGKEEAYSPVEDILK